MNKNCAICLNYYDDHINCNQCNKSVCLICYTKIDKCPYCRLKYDTPAPKITAEEALKKIDRSFETINELLERVEHSFRLIRYMNNYKHE